MGLFTRSTDQKPADPQTPDIDKAIVMRFLTQGGATVEVRSHRFQTRYTHRGRPNVYSFDSSKTRTVDGYRWTCRGCGTCGEIGISDYNYLDTEEGRARDDANAHAASCRAMP